MSITNDWIVVGSNNRIINRYTMTCDCCGEELCSGYGFQSADYMFESARQMGWACNQFINGERSYICDGCKEHMAI